MRVSKWFYLGVPILLIVVMLILVFTSANLGPGIQPYDVLKQTGPRLLIPLLIHIAIQLRLVYLAWASIQDGFARTSPGKAAGLLLVPVFNLYWLFPVVWGFAQDFNAHARRRGLAVQELIPGLYLLYCILFCLHIGLNLLGLQPPVLFSISIFFFFFCLVAMTCDAINALAVAPLLPASSARP